MDIEKAIRVIESMKTQYTHALEHGQVPQLHRDLYEKYIKSYDLAMGALRKQLPQKGIPLNSAKNHNFVECGACNEDMGMYYQYCPKCGQKSDWS